MKREDIINSAVKLYSGYDYSLVVDTKKNDDVFIVCHEHGVFKKRLSRFLKGSGCPKCSGRARKTFEEFVKEATLVHNGFYSYNDSKYINSHTKIGITCPLHGIFYQSPTNHLNGNGCPKCKSDKLKLLFSSNTVEFIESSRKVHGDKYDYSRVCYKNNHTEVCIICPIHGEFWQLPHNHLQGKGCPMCNESKLEAHIDKVLKDNNIKYSRQWHLPWDKRYSLDFFIEECNVGIECQGIQHFEDGHFKNESLVGVQKRDRYKLESCEKNGISIIYFSDEFCKKYGCICNDDELIATIYNCLSL